MSYRNVVLAYHAVGECAPAEDHHNLFVPPEAFERQMRYLAERRKVVPLASIVAGTEPRGRHNVAITFDDGYRNVLEIAAPILARFGFPATVFVPTAWIGRANEWDEPSRCDLRIMSDDELRAVEAAGVSVQSHGDGHLDLSDSEAATVRSDLTTSMKRLTEVVQRPRYLAYPYGRSSPEARRVAEEVGFEAAFTIERLHEGRYAWERVQVGPRDGSLLFALKSSGRYLTWRKSPAVSKTYDVVKPLARRALLRSR